jgi:hypothetical protein
MEPSMTLEYKPQQFSSLFNTPLGQGLWSFLNEPDSLLRMETATYLGRPALEPLSPVLEQRFGDDVFADQMKRMCGHMVRQVLESRGYRLDRNGVPITTTGNRFSSGSRYILG